MVVLPVRMKIKRVGWWIVINDSGGTVKTFPLLFPVWSNWIVSRCVWHVNVTVLLLAVCYYWYPVTVAVLVASTMFLPVCKRTEHTGLFLGLVVLDGISYRKYHSIFWNDLEDFDHIFCTILVLCFVCWFLNDRRFSVAGSFSIVSRTSVICAIT